MNKNKKTLEELYVPTVLHKPRDISFNAWREENGIPDWTKRTGYPKELGKDKIKWEFLRRNYYYKLLYSEFVDGDGEFQRNRMNSDWDENYEMAESEFAAIEYELPDLIDPRITAINLGNKIFARHFRGSLVHGHLGDGSNLRVGNAQHKTADLIDDDRYAVFVFDLRYAIPQQINTRVAPKLKAMQRRYEKASGIKASASDKVTKDYVKHLQVLDAYSERAHPIEIGRTVFSLNKDDKKARDTANREFKRAMTMWEFF